VIHQSAMSCPCLECTAGVSGAHGFVAMVRALRDPRDPRGVRHPLAAVVLAALCAMACGFDTQRAIGQWVGGASQEVLARLGFRPRRGRTRIEAPSAATVRRILALVPPGRLEGLLRVFEEVKGQVAVDGKTLRGSRTAEREAVVLLGAMLADGTLAAQQRVADKTNEITGFAALLCVLDLQDCLVTADALHCQRGHARVLVEEMGAHYLFTVKRNQPDLFAACRAVPWEQVRVKAYDRTRGHGRLETRAVQAVSWRALDFPHARQVARVVRHRTDLRTGRRSRETVYAITDMSPALAGPVEIAAGLRAQWGIENKIHHVRDVAFREDASKIRTGHGPQNTATLRSIALNFLRKAGHSIADARRALALEPFKAPLDLFGIPCDLRVHP